MNKLYYGDRIQIIPTGSGSESTFKRAQRQKKDKGQQPDLFGG